MKEEKIYKCPFCPCQFSSEHDLNLHKEAFGEGSSHFYKWRQVHGLRHTSYEKWKETQKAGTQGSSAESKL